MNFFAKVTSVVLHGDAFNYIIRIMFTKDIRSQVSIDILDQHLIDIFLLSDMWNLGLISTLIKRSRYFFHKV